MYALVMKWRGCHQRYGNAYGKKERNLQGPFFFLEGGAGEKLSNWEGRLLGNNVRRMVGEGAEKEDIFMQLGSTAL